MSTRPSRSTLPIRSVAATLLVAGIAGCDRADPAAAGSSPAPPTASPSFRFTEVTPACGIDMSWTSGRTPTTQILEAKGGGVALIDYDGDGDLDVFVPNGATLDDPEHGPGCRLFENMGGMLFRDATAAAGLTLRRWGIGVAVGDYDGNGHDDLFVACYRGNALLRNVGDGHFEDVTDQAGLNSTSWSTAAAFGDLDDDGDLDLYVANYLSFDIDHPPPISSFKGEPVFRGPIGLPPQADVLYENLGDGTFRDITAASGCGTMTPEFGLGAVILDFDDDRLQDIYVGNDSGPNFLFRNMGGMRFEEVGARNGLAVNVDGAEQATMGIAIGDVNGDGFADVFTTNFSNDTNTLHVSKSGRFFDDETRRYALGMVSFPFVGWAAGLYDLDHDGDEDLLAFNGHVYPNATLRAMDSTYLQPPLLFARDGASFRLVGDASAGPWLTQAHCDRGAAFGDIDRDGDIDVVVVELNGPVRVLRNDGGKAAGGGWLIVELSPKGLGSRVECRSGELHQVRWIFSGGSFVSASAQMAHFGLPAGGSTVELRIVWPDGHEQILERVAPDQHLVVSRQ